MLQSLFWIVAIPFLAVLLLFNIRRIVFTLAILLPEDEKKRTMASERAVLPKTLILVACRDEAPMIQGLCQAISRLDYPQANYRVVLIDDGSTDGTGARMREAARHPAWHVMILPTSIGKAAALNAALAQFSFGEIIYVFDADHRPAPSALKQAVEYFSHPDIAAVAGFTKVTDSMASPSAYYASVESYTNQLVTIRAKDRLDLAPALLGSNCGYRRSALVACGGFRAGALSEDSDLTVTFYRAGYKIRFAESAISYQQVPQSVRGYLRQHIRWGRGLNDVAKVHGMEILRDQNLSWPLRLELLVFTAGYLDRLAIAGTAILTVYAYLAGQPFQVFLIITLFALLTPLAQIIVLFIKEHMSSGMWVRLPWIPVFFALDVFAALRAMLDSLLNRSRVWTRTERIQTH